MLTVGLQRLPLRYRNGRLDLPSLWVGVKKQEVWSELFVYGPVIFNNIYTSRRREGDDREDRIVPCHICSYWSLYGIRISLQSDFRCDYWISFCHVEQKILWWGPLEENMWWLEGLACLMLLTPHPLFSLWCLIYSNAPRGCRIIPNPEPFFILFFKIESLIHSKK